MTALQSFFQAAPDLNPTYLSICTNSIRWKYILFKGRCRSP
ncbi:hypothetical protein B8V81_2098 [Paenibacillus pasadenensis]|uniref:Uncharacterized protein n=1 Tax=Paenibacillus pasadenensis TaxID=217090 RepID=A0A2N5MZZ4_9BACL|nr:hypothetical protein B8V81_2098 [Paenibacillus pasadenensis]